MAHQAPQGPHAPSETGLGSKSRLLLFGILGIAALLRLWGIDFGLPYEGLTYNQLTYEEIQEVHRALKLGAGEYYWGFGKGGLYLLLFFEYGVYFVISWAFGWISDTREFALKILEDRTTAFMIGRITVALMGTLTCFVMYEIGRRLYDRRVAIAVAAIAATAYFHGAFSSVINVDIGATLALWTSILAYVQYEHTQKRKYLIGAGALGAVAIAFKLPAAIILPFLFLAISTSAGNQHKPREMLKECSVIFLTLLATLTVIAPEWVLNIGSIPSQFSGILGLTTDDPVDVSDIDTDIRSITILGGSWAGYLRHLLKDYNVALTISAVLGIGFGLFRRQRWDVLWTVLIVVFVGIMSLADRSTPERYLLPIMPAIWLLGSRGLAAISERFRPLMPLGLAIVVAIPLFGLIRQAYEKMQPETRLIAKDWIEANVPSGARILMDGMRYRFGPSPPLNPDAVTVSREVGQIGEEGEGLGRGVSDLALSLYQEALTKAEGPTYELHSTTHGLGVKTPSYYVSNCFDYIVTSSYIAERFAPGQANRERYPASAHFYDLLSTDPRFQQVFQAVPRPWKSSGPIITVYKIVPACETP